MTSQVQRLMPMLGLILVQGCMVRHIEPYAAKKRDWNRLPTVQLDSSKDSAQRSKGSLFTDDGDDLFVYRRARRPGDILSVKISESSLADGRANTKLDRQVSESAAVSALLGLMQQINTEDARIVPGSLVGAETKRTFQGKGTSDRSTKVEAVIPAMVVAREPSGNLRIEGRRVLLVNDEEHHFYLSGLIRVEDIDSANTIESTKIAEAEMEFSGRGNITSKNRQGWLATTLDWIWPF